MRTSQTGRIRHSTIAGTWYPGTEQRLSRAVDDYLVQGEAPRVRGELLGLISPHAGYAYSGQTAAYAYRQLEGLEIDTVVIIGPSHRAWLGDLAVSTEDAYETPLGLVPLDRAFIADLEKSISLNHTERDAEHSLEIQLPFLQRQLGNFRLVPLLMGADGLAWAQELAGALVKAIGQRTAQRERVLMVASSDLHHIDDYDEVVSRDQAVVEAIAAYDLDSLASLLAAPRCTVCGRVPILTVLHAARSLGADAVRVLHQTNSGDVTGQRWPGQYTVGYVAAAIYKSA